MISMCKMKYISAFFVVIYIDFAAGVLRPCLDSYAKRLGVTALPSSASLQYKNNFCQYTYIPTSNGNRIEIFGGSELSSLQLYRARKILEFYLENLTSCKSCYGANKNAVRDAMGRNRAKLDMPNGAHRQPGAGQSLQGQELYQMEVPVEGDNWFMQNNMNHRDAAFEEILHLVHDTGIGIDGSDGYPAGALPGYQKKIRDAMNNAKPTWLGGSGLWGQNEWQWVNELKAENSLTQEYLAAVIDVYYGLWEAYGAGMWGIYKPSSRTQLKNLDPKGFALVPQFFNPRLTWMVMLSPTLSGTFSMTLDRSKPYTYKSQYYLHATLLGTKSANIIGNSGNNCLGPNAGTNTLDGKSGTDVVLFRGNCAEYSITCSSSNICRVQDKKSGRDGVTTTKAVEFLSFMDGDFALATKRCTQSFSMVSRKCWKLVDVTASSSGATGGSSGGSSGGTDVNHPGPAHTTCKDSNDIRFRYNGMQRSCYWLRNKKGSVDDYKLCGHGSGADMGCIKTCGNCGIIKNCWQDAYAEHWVNKNLKFKTCKWLSTRAIWKKKLCKRDKEAFYVCRKVCQSC